MHTHQSVVPKWVELMPKGVEPALEGVEPGLQGFCGLMAVPLALLDLVRSGSISAKTALHLRWAVRQRWMA